MNGRKGMGCATPGPRETGEGPIRWRSPRPGHRSAGFTLVELLVAAVIGTVLMGAVYQVLVSNQRISGVQREQVVAHQTVRAGLDLLAQELREVSASGGDLLVLGGDSVAFRAFRAHGVVCAVAADGATSIRVMPLGRPFADEEQLYVFADDDPETAVDDAWFSSITQSAGTLGAVTCGADNRAAQRIMPGLSATQLLRVRPGATVRSWERVRYGMVVRNGESFLMRQVQGQAAAPLVGPLEPGVGLVFDYLDAIGNETAAAAQVARVQITLRTMSEARTEAGQQVRDSLTTSVFLRN